MSYRHGNAAAMLWGIWPRLADHSRDTTIPRFLRVENRVPLDRDGEERVRLWLLSGQPASQPASQHECETPRTDLPRNMDPESWALLRIMEATGKMGPPKRPTQTFVREGLAQKRAEAWSGDLSINPADRLTMECDGDTEEPYRPPVAKEASPGAAHVSKGKRRKPARK